jgi:hypothetical protein
MKRQRLRFEIAEAPDEIAVSWPRHLRSTGDFRMQSHTDG